MLVCTVSSLRAQDINATTTFVSQNIWRGMYQTGGSIQPEIVVSYKNWETSIWGTTDFGMEEKEIDIAVKYSWDDFSIGITDYWFGNKTGVYGKNHIPEINLSYSFPECHLAVGYNTILWGDDGNFSGYMEISYSPSWEEWDFDFTAGVTPWSNTMLDTGSFSISCLSSTIRRDVKFSGTYSPECSLSFIYNPNTDMLFWLAGVTFPF